MNFEFLIDTEKTDSILLYNPKNNTIKAKSSAAINIAKHLGFPSNVLVIFLIILVGALFFKIWLDFNYDILLITNHRVIIQDYNLFGSTANAVGYHSLLNIVPDNRGFFNWLINAGKINIETAADQKTLSFQDMKNAHKVAQIINQYRASAKNNPNQTQSKIETISE